ncbi:MAG: tol-pal system protein [Alkalilacustris sp.]
MLTAVLAAPAAGGTLADIRSDLEALRAELAQLQAELAPGPGTGSGQEAVPESVLDRVSRLEGAVQRLTGMTDELQFRIERVVADGTNRIGDIEFRLNELAGQDPAAFVPPEPLGGAADPAAWGAPAEEATPAPLAGEQAAFDAAEALHAAGDWIGAEVAFADFAEAYPVSALLARGHLLRADALERLDEPARAARAWLSAYQADAGGVTAPVALLGLGSALAALEQGEEACIMLDELRVRFPASPEAAAGEDKRAEIGCP